MSVKELTGRHVLMITVGAFAIIIAVNVSMAVLAVGTFPGLETKNSYVASQTFDADRAAQDALGWDVSVEVAAGNLRLTILGPDGRAVEPAELSVMVGRTTIRDQDRSPVLAFDGRAHVAPVDLDAGKWEMRVSAVAEDGTAFRRRLILHVK